MSAQAGRRHACPHGGRAALLLWLVMAGAAAAAYLNASVQDLDKQLVVAPNASPDITRRSYSVRMGGQMGTYTFGIAENKARFMMVKVANSKSMDVRGFVAQFFGDEVWRMGEEDRRTKCRAIYRASRNVRETPNGPWVLKPTAVIGYAKVEAGGLKLKIWPADQSEPSG